MGCLISKCINSNEEPKIKIIDYTLTGAAFNYLRPKSTISFSGNRKYNVPVDDISFQGWWRTVCIFCHIILNRENIFCSFRELCCRLLVLVLTIVVMTLFFSWKKKKKMAENNLPIHPWERLPQHATPLLDTPPQLNISWGRFFISEDELEFRINSLCSQFLKIQAFAKFVRDSHKRIINQRVVSGDLTMFSDFFSMFLSKEFVNPRGIFQKICHQHPFEFLIMFDFCRL